MDALLRGITDLLPLVMLLGVRVAMVLILLPAPFGRVSPDPYRIVLGMAIAMAIALPNRDLAGSIDLTLTGLAVAALGEALVGAVIGLTVEVTLAAANVAGSMAGTSMGLGFAQQVDPFTGEEAAPTSMLLTMLATAIFLILQGHHVAIEALAGSVRLAPPGHTFDLVTRSSVVEFGGSMVAHGLQIAAPVVGTMFIIHVGKGLITKAAPKVQLLALFFSVAISAGLLVLFVAAPSVAEAVAAHVRRLPDELVTVLGGR